MDIKLEVAEQALMCLKMYKHHTEFGALASILIARYKRLNKYFDDRLCVINIPKYDFANDGALSVEVFQALQELSSTHLSKYNVGLSMEFIDSDCYYIHSHLLDKDINDGFYCLRFIEIIQ